MLKDGTILLLCGAQEEDVSFPPTYRLEKGKDEYSNKKNQNPSYTDRILHRSLPRLEHQVEPLFYGADFALTLVRCFTRLSVFVVLIAR
jgi:hypothetical protein